MLNASVTDNEQNTKVKILSLNDIIVENQKDRQKSSDKSSRIKRIKDNKSRPLSPNQEYMRLQSMWNEMKKRKFVKIWNFMSPDERNQPYELFSPKHTTWKHGISARKLEAQRFNILRIMKKEKKNLESQHYSLIKWKNLRQPCIQILFMILI